LTWRKDISQNTQTPEAKRHLDNYHYPGTVRLSEMPLSQPGIDARYKLAESLGTWQLLPLFRVDMNLLVEAIDAC